MGTMQLVRGVGGSISLGGRSYTKTGMEPVVFIPAYTTLSGTVWHYWAVLGRSKGAAAGTASTPEYTTEHNLTVNGRQVYVLTLDKGAFENGTLTISGPGTIPAEIQTGAAGQWYDLWSMTGENAALQEAELLLRAAEQEQVAPRMPGGGGIKEIAGWTSINNAIYVSLFQTKSLTFYYFGTSSFSGEYIRFDGSGFYALKDGRYSITSGGSVSIVNVKAGDLLKNGMGAGTTLWYVCKL